MGCGVDARRRLVQWVNLVGQDPAAEHVRDRTLGLTWPGMRGKVGERWRTVAQPCWMLGLQCKPTSLVACAEIVDGPVIGSCKSNWG